MPVLYRRMHALERRQLHRHDSAVQPGDSMIGQLLNTQLLNTDTKGRYFAAAAGRRSPTASRRTCQFEAAWRSGQGCCARMRVKVRLRAQPAEHSGRGGSLVEQEGIQGGEHQHGGSGRERAAIEGGQGGGEYGWPWKEAGHGGCVGGVGCVLVG